ncbi:MAG: hypothetical protein KDI61_00285 [Alphaproteobacteria bacterium]|nr:hypothetical protein [Alphaproteobacteria bacterium]
MGTGGSSGFREGVRAATSLPVVFLNPADFHREHYLKTHEVHPDDLVKAREVIRQQGVDPSGFSDRQLAILVRRSLAGPFGHAMTVDNLEGKSIRICLANGPEGSIHGHSDVLLARAGIDLARVSAIPGWEQYRERIIGIHEGTHCDQDMDTKGMTDEQKDIFLLGREAEGDRAAVQWLRQNNLNELAQALIDIRALTTVEDRDDVRHATSILIDHPDVHSSQAHIDAARDIKFQMVIAVAADRKLTMEQAIDMFIHRRDEFVGHVDHLLARGAFNPSRNTEVNNNPYIEEYIRAYAGAYHRQIMDRRLTPTPGAPALHHAVPGGSHGSLDTAEGDDAARYAFSESDEEDDLTEPADTTEDAIAVAVDDQIPGGRGAPVIHLSDESGALLTIDGLSVPDYWRQIADRDLALQRLEVTGGVTGAQMVENQAVSPVLAGGNSKWT